jgi:hypothetical protein
MGFEVFIHAGRYQGKMLIEFDNIKLGMIDYNHFTCSLFLYTDELATLFS